MVSQPSSRKGFSRGTSRGHSPPPPSPGAPTAQLGEEGRRGRAQVPLRSGGRSEGIDAQISETGLGTPGTGCEGERAAGSWFPRFPRAPHSVSLQVSTQFCQRRGAVLHPAQPARDTGGSGERLRARGVWGGKNGPREFTRTLLFQPTVRLTRQPLRAGPHSWASPL